MAAADIEKERNSADYFSDDDEEYIAAKAESEKQSRTGGDSHPDEVEDEVDDGTEESSESSGESDAEQGTSKQMRKLSFRSYNPITPELREMKKNYKAANLDADSAWLDTEIKSLMHPSESLDQVFFARKAKENWDLKRHISDKLAELKRRTALSIQQLIKEKIELQKEREDQDSNMRSS